MRVYEQTRLVNTTMMIITNSYFIIKLVYKPWQVILSDHSPLDNNDQSGRTTSIVSERL